MSAEGLDCWGDYPMEHGCICGNDCAPPRLPLDPAPWTSHHGRHDEPDPAWWDFDVEFAFQPRSGYSQNREDYA